MIHKKTAHKPESSGDWINEEFCPINSLKKNLVQIVARENRDHG
jgi:hypothetical protein